MTLQYGCADVDALAGALALDAVDADEQRAAREHLATCPEPHAELRSLLGADAALAASLEPIQPSAGLRDRLMATVAEVPQDRPRSRPRQRRLPARRSRDPLAAAGLTGCRRTWPARWPWSRWWR